MPAINPPLSPEKWARIREIFARILEEPEEHHSTLLERWCGDDPEIRMEMDGLLAAHGHVGSFLEETASVIFNQFLAPALRELNTGTVLASRFHILRYIDTGGMGAVYEAWDAELQENVALKTIRPEIAMHPAIIERFKKEVRQAHHVTHPNICRVYDLFSHESPPGHREWFLTMQLLKGETLQQRLRRNGPLARGEALELVRQLISGLSEAHRHGIVHRDFKSGNVMLVEDGNEVRALITDFGLATDVINTALKTKEHAGQGTPAYSAPEQWFEGTATPPADQYSLGVVMYEMLTGERPIPARCDGESVVPARLLPDRKLDRHWERAILRCLHVRPEDRFPSLEDILKTIDPARRRTVVLGWAAAVLAIIVVSATTILVMRDLNRLPVLANQRKITDEGMALSQGPRLSRDGKTLVYVSDQERSGKLDVFVYPLPNGPSQRITSYPEINERPAISPDGKWIAFETAQRPAGIYLADVNSGAGTLIAPDGQEPSFSPNGRWILYWTGGDEFAVSPNGRIFLYDMWSGQSQQLAKQMDDARVPLWNSDGDHILFSGCGPDTGNAYPDCKDWWITSRADEAPRVTGAARVLKLQGLKPTQYFGGWQDDTVVFSASQEPSPIVELWELKLDWKTATISNQPRRLVRGNSHPFIISSSVAGKSIATCEWHPSVHIRRIDLTPGASPKETTIAHDPKFDLGASISHNGQWLIFTRGSDKNRAIHVINTLNGLESQPDLHDREINWPIIDDSGTRIAFEATPSDVPVIRISTDGTTRVLCRDCRNPSGWINHWTQILYRDSKTSAIKVQDISANEGTTVLSGARDEQLQDAVWSPENGFITFTVSKKVQHGKDRRTVLQVYAARYVSAKEIPRTDWIEVTGEEDYSRKSQWSGDGKTIYYLSKRDGHWCVWGQGFDPELGRLDGEPFAVQHYHNPKSTPGSINAQGLNLSVAGNQLYLSVLETTGTIWVGELARPGLFSRDD